MSIPKKIFDSLNEDTKEYLRKYIEPEKKESPFAQREEQKKELTRLSHLLGLRPEKSRKLSLYFDKSNNKNINNDELNKNCNNKVEEDHNNSTNNDFNDTTDDDYSDELKDKFSFNNLKKDETNYFDKKKIHHNNHNKISLEDVVSYFKLKGVVGEEALSLKIFLAASNNISFGVEGYSGSGKTFVVDKLIDLFDSKDLYRLDLSSKMAVFYDSKNINNFKTIYIPELQKALQETKSPIVEIVKNLTEGKDVQRIVTDSKKKGNKTFKINSGKSIIYTLASENYFKKDEELNRRFLRFKTNYSDNHIENILNHKSSKRQDFDSFKNVNLIEHDLKLNFNYLKGLNVQVFDPYSNYISEHLPKTQKSVGYVDHYFSLVDAATKFHCEDRFSFSYDGNNIIVSNLEDHYLIHKIYYKEFLETLKGFSERNNFEAEVEEINLLENKAMDWNNALNIGLLVVEKKLNNYFDKYMFSLKDFENIQSTDKELSFEFDNDKYLSHLKSKYAFIPK